MTTYRLAGDPALRVRVLPLGLACCALEVESAVRLGLLVPEAPGEPPPARTVLVVSGTVTEPLVPVVEAAAAEAGADEADTAVSVLAFGVCASTGGPYWDAPTVVNGADRFVPVDHYVPGCPPRPEALVDALRSAGAGAA